MSSSNVGPTSGQSLIGADGKPRAGWGLVDAPPVLPTEPGKLIEAPKFGDVEAPKPKPGVPSEIKPGAQEVEPETTVPPVEEPGKVEYSEPPPEYERTIEVAGTGMGASKKYTMLESEALAVYSILRDNKGNISPQDLASKLKEKYGIDADVTTVDGHQAVVNRATGNTIAVDTNGNGSLDMSDLQFKEALLAAGIDPDWKANPKVFDLASKVVADAIAASDKRRKDEEAAYQKHLAVTKAADAGGAARVAEGRAEEAPAAVDRTETL